MKPPDNLNLTEHEFIEYLENECKEYIRSQILRIDEDKHAYLDDSIHNERIFFHTSYRNRIVPLTNCLESKHGVTIEIRNYDRYTECMYITGRLIEIEGVKSTLNEHLKR
ncbi:hypothetical protein THOM_0451 [Trachipleistophora hominis]|uniref:Uncharacterized protein n=1 Tax=Trachipleistophora hominis TaxID=72359 RepID=L7K0A5_TRAHO|nr:hypothetical protein THOM_0451 [Trachipleistophora hominis]